MAAVRFQLALAGTSGTNAAALTAQTVAHAGKPGQKILILSQLHLQSSFSGSGPLGKNIQNQGAAVQHRASGDLLQSTDIAGGQLIVEYDHIGLSGLCQHPHLLGLSLADKAVGIRGMAVLQHLGHTEAAGSFEEGFQLLQGLIRSCLFLFKAVCIQAYQNGSVLYDLIFCRFHGIPHFNLQYTGKKNFSLSPEIIILIVSLYHRDIHPTMNKS